MARIEDFESASPGDDTRPVGIANILLSERQLQALLNGAACAYNTGNMFIIVQLDDGVNKPIASVSEFNKRYTKQND